MTNALSSVVGLVTIGQSPRSDVVPEIAALIGPGVDVQEAGALDGLGHSEIEALAPTGHDEILVTPTIFSLPRKNGPSSASPPWNAGARR